LSGRLAGGCAGLRWVWCPWRVCSARCRGRWGGFCAGTRLRCFVVSRPGVWFWGPGGCTPPYTRIGEEVGKVPEPAPFQGLEWKQGGGRGGGGYQLGKRFFTTTIAGSFRIHTVGGGGGRPGLENTPGCGHRGGRGGPVRWGGVEGWTWPAPRVWGAGPAVLTAIKSRGNPGLPRGGPPLRVED